MEFNPDRWNNIKDLGFNYIPFSAGPRYYFILLLKLRNCIGQHMAKIETKIMLIYILKQFKLVFNEK